MGNTSSNTKVSKRVSPPPVIQTPKRVPVPISRPIATSNSMKVKDTIDVHYVTPNLRTTTTIPRSQYTISADYQSTMTIEYYNGTVVSFEKRRRELCSISAVRQDAKSITIEFHPLSLVELPTKLREIVWKGITTPYPTLGEYQRIAKQSGIDIDTKSERLDVPLWEYEIMGTSFPTINHKLEILPDRIKRGDQEVFWHNIVHVGCEVGSVTMYTNDGPVKWIFPSFCTQEIKDLVKIIEAYISDPRTKALRLEDVYQVLSKKVPHDTVIEIMKMI